MLDDVAAEVSACLATLADRNPRARRWALDRLAAIGTAAVIPEVRRAAVDRDPMVAFQAGRTLRELLARGPALHRGPGPVAPPPGRAAAGPEPAELRRAGLDLLRPYSAKLGALVTAAAPEVARAAASALGKIGDVRSTGDLVAGLRRDELAAHSAMALSALGDASCLDLLLELMASRDPRLVRHAVFAAGVYPERCVLEAVGRLLEHPDGEVRADAALVLGSAGGAGAVGQLRALLDDGDERVVLRVLEALARVAPAVFLEHAAATFSTSGDRVRATTVALLGEAPAAPERLALLERALEDSDPRVRANAVEVVAALELAPDRRRALLDKVRSDRNNRVLANLAVALSRVDIVASLQVLSGLLNSPDKWERASAVFAAGYIDEPSVAAWLANILLLEEDRDVLANAVASLARCGGEEVADRMVASVRHRGPQVRAGAARVLGVLARKGVRRAAAREALLGALEGEADPDVLVAILQALPAASDAAHLRRVERCLRHGAPRVQAAAIELLASLGSIEMLPYVEPFIFSLDGSVKAGATLALWKQGHLDVVHVLGQMLEGREGSEAGAAAFAIGEIGLTLWRLDDYPRCYLLAAALAARVQATGPGAVGPAGAGTAAPAEGAALERLVPALNLLAHGRVGEAGDLLRQLLPEAPDDPLVHYLLGVACRRMERREEARDHLARAAAPGDFLDAALDLASLHHERGEPPEALRWFVVGARIRAKAVNRLADLSDELAGRERLQGATLATRGILEALAPEGRLHRAMGELLSALGLSGEALGHFVRALLADPSDGRVAAATVRVLEGLGAERAARAVAGLVSPEEVPRG